LTDHASTAMASRRQRASKSTSMSSSSPEIIPHLPRLHRYARALTGSRSWGDALAAAAMEAFEVRRRSEEMPARVALFRTLSMLLETCAQPDGSNPCDPVPTGSATPLSVQALLLCALEEFSQEDAANILGVSPGRLNELVEEGGKVVQPDDRALLLILDSDVFVTLDLESALEGGGYRVCGTPKTRAEALECAQIHRPEVAILTSAMRFGGDSDPLRVAEEVQQVCNASLVLLTAYPERFLRGEEHECAFIMAKPFQPTAVVALVGQALRLGRDQTRRRPRKPPA
jgi:CheY-like chemotaxis protein